jgi:spermidine synthase
MIARRYLSPALLASVVVIATSGLVYELIAGTIASYVLGDSVAQFSFVIGLYLFGMGVGSYLSKYVEGDLLRRFVEIELAIALVGGFSAPALFLIYTSFGAFRAALYLIVLVVGTLVGLEIPLLIRLLEFQLSLKDLVARVLALDYVGALGASLLFPLVLLPRIGIHKTSLVVGLLNAAVAFAATFLLPVEHQKRWRMRAQCFVIALALGVGMVQSDRALLRGETNYFGAPVVYAAQSPFQRIVITKSRRTTRLFLNGQLQFSSDDEHRYHETLVHPAVAALGRAPKQVLVLGGGDGLAVRELLRYPEVERIVLVDLDPAVTTVFRNETVARALNHGALDDPRVTVKNEDAFTFLDQCQTSFDLAVVDFPDPGNYAIGKLYTLTFYERLRERVGVRGVAVVQTTSPYFARRSFWMMAETIAAAQFEILPMHVHVPSFGEWGFVIAGPKGMRAPDKLLVPAEQLRFLNDEALAQLFRFPRDMAQVSVGINRLNDQQLVSIYTTEWDAWQH